MAKYLNHIHYSCIEISTIFSAKWTIFRVDYYFIQVLSTVSHLLLLQIPNHGIFVIIRFVNKNASTIMGDTLIDTGFHLWPVASNFSNICSVADNKLHSNDMKSPAAHVLNWLWISALLQYNQVIQWKDFSKTLRLAFNLANKINEKNFRSIRD